MKSLLLILTSFSIVLSSCKKLEDYEGNNVSFEETNFEFTETMTFVIPNSIFSVPFDVSCVSLLGAEIDFNSMIPAENPNPYAHLVENIIPKSIKMELVGVNECDLSMLGTVEVFMVDSAVQSANDIVYYDPLTPSAAYNAKKMGEYYNAADGTNEIPDDIGNIMYLQPDVNIQLDEFIHDEKFNVYMVTTIDRAFVEDQAVIKTTLDLDVTLSNEE